MNYADFGVSGPDELEQDEWSLTRPTFETPKGGVLTVVGWKGRLFTTKQYIVRCSLCSSDRELFGQGVFLYLKGRGTYPCGCGVKPRWSEEQYKIRVQREAKRRGYTFNFWAGRFKGSTTQCSFTCHTHGVWSTTSLHRFFRGDGCPSCGVEKRTMPTTRTKSTSRRSNAIYPDRFMASGGFLEGTEFWRSEKKDKNAQSYWKLTCPQCSHDDYVKEGVCSGVFESHYSPLCRGCRPCRCSPTYRWSQEQREYQIKREMSQRSERGLSGLQFVKWTTGDGYVNSRSRFIYLCPEHGEQVIQVKDFFGRSCGCPRCAGKNQRQAYIVKVKDGKIPVALKLGIANNSDSRLADQNRTNLFQSTNIGVWEFKEVDYCKAAEKECKSTLHRGVLSKREMEDGWTETVSVLDLEKVIAIYEKHGGIRIK